MSVNDVIEVMIILPSIFLVTSENAVIRVMIAAPSVVMAMIESTRIEEMVILRRMVMAIIVNSVEEETFTMLGVYKITTRVMQSKESSATIEAHIDTQIGRASKKPDSRHHVGEKFKLH